jgi:hypothetical protein
MKKLDKCWRDIAERWERLGDTKRAEEARVQEARAREERAKMSPWDRHTVMDPDWNEERWWTVAFVYGELAKATGSARIQKMADWYYRYACFLALKMTPAGAEQAIKGDPIARWNAELRLLDLGYPFEVSGPAAAGDIPTLRAIFRERRRRKVPTMLDLGD